MFDDFQVSLWPYKWWCRIEKRNNRSANTFRLVESKSEMSKVYKDAKDDLNDVDAFKFLQSVFGESVIAERKSKRICPILEPRR